MKKSKISQMAFQFKISAVYSSLYLLVLEWHASHWYLNTGGTNTVRQHQKSPMSLKLAPWNLKKVKFQYSATRNPTSRIRCFVPGIPIKRTIRNRNFNQNEICLETRVSSQIYKQIVCWSTKVRLWKQDTMIWLNQFSLRTKIAYGVMNDQKIRTRKLIEEFCGFFTCLREKQFQILLWMLFC